MITVNIKDHWSDTKRIIVAGTLIPSGNYPTGGDVVNFGLPLIKSNSAPVYFSAFGLTPAYDYLPGIGTNVNNSLLKVSVPNTGVELAAGTYPAAVTGDIIQFYAVLPKFI